MSYLFCVILYERGRFDPGLIQRAVGDAPPSFAGECLMRASITRKVDGVFYFSGAFPTKALAFMYACEDYLVDGFPESVAAELRASGAESRLLSGINVSVPWL